MNRLALPLLALFALLLTACGGDDDDAPPTDATATASSPGAANTNSPATPAGATVPASDVAGRIRALPLLPELADGYGLGRKDARATLVVFEDFQCPHCLRYTANFEALIIEEYVKPGKLRLEFRNFPILGEESARAAIAAQCAAAQNRFWPYHKQLFLVQAEAGQATAEKLNVGRFADAKLREYAAAAGLDVAAFETCYAGDAAVDGVANHIREAQGAGIRGTPGFILNGQPLAGGSPATADAWRKLLDDATK